MTQHAILSASAADRWLHCPPSARACAKYPDTKSEYAQEGTDAHALCEYLVKKSLGMKTKDPTEDLTFYDAVMQSAAEGYAEFVLEKVQEAKETCKDPLVMVEQRLDFSDYVPQGFGTGDCVIAADDMLYIIDFKYGMGVLVDAEKNPQLMCYALGAIQLFGELYDFQNVSMSIYQPRRQNVVTYTMPKAELLNWAETVLKPTAKLAFEGTGEYKAGSHCKFCKARANCRKRAEYNLEMAKYDFVMPDKLTKKEIEVILPKINELISWAEDIKEYALKKALAGEHYNGYKVVEGRTTRKYTSENDVAKVVIAEGLNPYQKKILGITAMTTLLGKKRFQELLGRFVYKPQGKPVLTTEDDARPEFRSPEQDFKEEK